MVGYVCLANNSSYIKKKLKLNSINVIDFNNSIRIDLLINNYFEEKKLKENKKKYKEEVRLKKQIKFAKRIVKVLIKNDITKVVIENDIYKKYQVIVNELYSSDIEVITGDELYENMITNIFEYIFENNKNIKIEEINLGIAINLITYNRLTFIRNISNSIKGLTILTDDTEKFDNLYKETLSENGLSIKVTDNYKNGLKNCNYIINYDIDNEKIINSNCNNCIFVNFSNRIDKVKRNFKGIIINDVKIKIEENSIIKNQIDINKFRNLAILESINVNNKMLEIVELIGVKEKVELSEIEKFEIYKKKKK